MTRSVPPLPLEAIPPGRSLDRRDPRIDLLRGLALMMIFINHIPYNALTYLTTRPFGFSDAAEIFVFLSGYSAWMCYPALIERRGWAVALRRIGRRCLTLWGVHVMLLCGTVLVALLRHRATGRLAGDVEPLLTEGLPGFLRALTLRALPPYLDILPLYIVLLAAFPLLYLGLRRRLGATFAASLALYAAAALLGWNLPNGFDPDGSDPTWTFNPFCWQVVFVLGACAAEGRCRGWHWLTQPPLTLRLCTMAVLGFAVLSMDPLHRWPILAAHLFPGDWLDDVWKSWVAPWRLLHALSLLYLLLATSILKRAVTLAPCRAAIVCGRHSLAVFSAGCLLSLLGRLVYGDLGITPALQLAVNGLGLGAQIGLAYQLERRVQLRRLADSEDRTGRQGCAPSGPRRFVLSFLLGAAVVISPGLAFTRRIAPMAGSTLLHDYFPPPHFETDTRFRIVTFGSSSTHGFGASSRDTTYPAQLRHLLAPDSVSLAGFDVVNRGVDGETIMSMLGRLDDDILPRHPDLIVWQLGSNDALQGMGTDAFASSLRAGIAQIRAAGIPLMLIGPQWNPDPAQAALFGRMNDAMLAVSRADALPMVDRFALMQRWIQDGHLSAQTLLAADGLHMTDNGYALLAYAVYRAATKVVPGLNARMRAASVN